MRFELFDGREPTARQRWIERWQRWPAREVQSHPGYLELFAGDGDRIRAAAMDTGEGGILYAFVQRPLADGATDLTSPYGYGGAFAWGDGSAASTDFWTAFEGWARDERVVSEFVRFGVGNVSLIASPHRRTHRQDNVVVPTSMPADQLWMRHEHKVRKNVNKAKRAGLSVVVDETGARLDDFLRIYQTTMTRRDARATYYFPREFFERLQRDLAGQFMYFHALLDGVVVSTELALVSATRMYSFLGGTDEASFALRPNDLLKHEMINWARDRGIVDFVLGGGYEPNDGIFRYKRDFFPDGVVPFFTGERVLDEHRYQALTEARHGAGAGATLAFFPAYRAPVAPPA